MENTETEDKAENELLWHDASEKVGELPKPSSVNISVIQNRNFTGSQEEPTVPMKTIGTCVMEKKTNIKEKPEEKPPEKHILTLPKDVRKTYTNVMQKTKPPAVRKKERDFRRFKAKYNASLGNIMRDWMNLIYCILILRMNLIKLVLERLENSSQSDLNLQKQVMLESRIIYTMIRNAQHYSQKKFVCMWIELEKLILNRVTLKNALETVQTRDSGLRDWKTASTKLSQLQDEFTKAQSAYKAIYQSKNESECALKENFSKLESLARSKNLEYERLVEEITELKKKEAQMRGKILLNMKSYKDLKTKRQHLLNAVNEMNQLKKNQSGLIKEYTLRIQTLKNQIEEKEKQITVEKEEKKKIKAKLENFGDFSVNSASSFQDN